MAGLLFTGLAFSQVGINNTTPKATLDVTAKTLDGSQPEGLIAPRLTGDQIKAADFQYGSNQTGTLIYAISAVSASTTKTANINAAGYYYFDGNIWQKVINSNTSAVYSANNGLTMSGNNVKLGGTLTEATSISGVTATNRLTVTGTGIDAINFDNNTFSVDANNDRIGIGTNSPAQKLDVNGKLRIGTVSSTSASSVSTLVRDNSTGEVMVAGTSTNTKPLNYVKYVISNVNKDWISDFNTNISSTDYTVVVVGSSFSEQFISSLTANTYNPVNVNAVVGTGGSWRLTADYNGGASANNGTWTIYCLILNNSQVKTLSDVTANLGGANTGSAAAPSGL
ncbi:hypothetical protein [Chryseobacterium viscerum]|uniref:Uncharacterized protein n=1 Tax=Chryseobacterium viscerum TaxID=1037377 RepID=A0A316WI93_9FLAO|nr:hypothetical protein [Chryseobacterium viscerum]PWN58170.1 hypothetical protein C1634_024695 [Chryseobacterium viscerum]